MSDPLPTDNDPCRCAEAPGCGHPPGPEARLAAAIWPGDDEPDAGVDQGDNDDSVWCRAEPSPLGSYMLVISYDQDNVLTLTRSQLLEYVATFAEALLRAQYVEGVRRQMRAVFARRGVDPDKIERTVNPFVLDLRQEWPPLPTFSPYRILPCVSAEGRTSVQVIRAGKVIVQFAAHNVQEHIVHALRVYASADLDSSYRRFLIGTVDIEPERASAVIDDLGNYLREE